jgi:hypothetical protein
MNTDSINDTCMENKHVEQYALNSVHECTIHEYANIQLHIMHRPSNFPFGRRTRRRNKSLQAGFVDH